MASYSNTFTFSIFFLLMGIVAAELSSNFYAGSCPQALSIIKGAVSTAVSADRGMGASLLRLHFHDCFVNGCDGSILLNDTADFTGEKTAIPNVNSVRGYELIDSIKLQLENQCARTVSCADILAVAARDAVVALAGMGWTVLLGRKDSTTASLNAANRELPSPFSGLSTLISVFGSKGFSAQEMVALSGAHSVGIARCAFFRNRIYDKTANIDPGFAQLKKLNCPSVGGDNNHSPLDEIENVFDNTYFRNLVERKGLLPSDQELFNGGSTDSIVNTYRLNSAIFFKDFGNAMIKMGNLSSPAGTILEIREHCWKRNGST